MKEHQTISLEVEGSSPSSRSLVTVVQIQRITDHPGADRLDLVMLSNGIQVVTGKHYIAGQRGVYFSPGCLIPGYLAEDLWIKGRASANCWTLVGSKIMRGILSPGVFSGEFYAKDISDARSVELFAIRGGKAGEAWIKWPYWRDHWKLGEEVSAYLGVREGQAP